MKTFNDLADRLPADWHYGLYPQYSENGRPVTWAAQVWDARTRRSPFLDVIVGTPPCARPDDALAVLVDILDRILSEDGVLVPEDVALEIIDTLWAEHAERARNEADVI